MTSFPDTKIYCGGNASEMNHSLPNGYIASYGSFNKTQLVIELMTSK